MKLSSWGVYDVKSKDERLKIRLANYIALTGIFLSLINSLINVYHQDWYDVMAGGIIIASLIGCLLLNKFNFHLLSKTLLIVLIIAILTIIYCVYGINLKLEPLYLVFIVSVILLFSETSHQLFLIGYIIAAYSFAQYFLAHYDSPLAKEINSSANVLYFLFGLTIIVMIIRSVLAVNENQKLLLKKKSRELENLISLASHELKTPIHNISNYSDLINLKMREANQNHVVKELKVIKDASLVMNDTLDNLISQVENTKNP